MVLSYTIGRFQINQNRPKRKLAAILNVDAVGYSRLMEDSEDITIQTINTHWGSMTALILKYEGRVVHIIGDNLMAEFDSTLNAVNCAVDIQKVIAECNAKLNPERKMLFRMGIHVGDIVVEENQISGDNVNIAARLEGIAEAGGIAVSGNVYNQVSGKVHLEFENLGNRRLKNIKTPVRVYRVLFGAKPQQVKPSVKKIRYGKRFWAAAVVVFFLTVTCTWVYRHYFTLPLPEAIDPDNSITFDLPNGPSIVVLPFKNMSGNSEQDYICDGITENIIYALSHVGELFVVARNSAFAFKEKSVDARQIGKDLGVRFVMNGNVQCLEKRIRVTVQLVESGTGKCIWSDMYDRPLDSLFRLQDDIAIKATEAMQVHVTDGETFRNRYDGIKDARVAMKILKAIEIVREDHNNEKISIGFREVEEIIEMDSGIQIAYSLLGMYNLIAIETGVCENSMICFAKATEAIRKAMSFDRKNSDTYIVSAYLFLLRKEHENAMNAAKHAILLNPNNADAYAVLGYIMSMAGRPGDGVRFVKKSLQLDPFASTVYLFQLGVAYFESGQYQKAVPVFRKVLARKSSHRGALHRIVASYSLLGDDRRARHAVSELMKVYPDFDLKGHMRIMPYKNKADHDRYLNALRKAGLPG